MHLLTLLSCQDTAAHFIDVNDILTLFKILVTFQRFLTFLWSQFKKNNESYMKILINSKKGANASKQ